MKRFLWLVLIGTIFIFAVSIIVTYFYLTATAEISVLSTDFVTSSISIFLYLYFLVLYITIAIVIPIIFAGIVFFKSDFIDDWFLFYIREHKEIFLWVISLSAFTLIVFMFLIIWSSYFMEPKDVVKIVQENWLNFLLLLEVFIFGLILVAIAKITEPYKLSSALADKISSKLIAKEPDSAVRKAFALFEDKLKQKVKQKINEDKLIGVHLIYKAFGKEGVFILDKDKQESFRDLMAGIYGVYRNPLMHGEIESLDKNTVITILTLIDKSVKILDELE